MAYGAVGQRGRGPVPIAVLDVGTLVPLATLVGSLMWANLASRGSWKDDEGVLNELANIVTLFLGLAIGSTMVGERFLQPGTLAILGLGIIAFGLDTATGLVFAKGLNRLAGGTFNPLIGAAGISAFPMAARVVQRVAQEEDFENFPLMHAMGANAAGQVARWSGGRLLGDGGLVVLLSHPVRAVSCVAGTSAVAVLRCCHTGAPGGSGVAGRRPDARPVNDGWQEHDPGEWLAGR